jgi:hypothetical protein
MAMKACSLFAVCFCLAWGCAKDEKPQSPEIVSLEQVPGVVMKAARERLPNVKFDSAWKAREHGQDVYEVRGKTSAGKVFEVEVTPRREHFGRGVGGKHALAVAPVAGTLRRAVAGSPKGLARRHAGGVGNDPHRLSTSNSPKRRHAERACYNYPSRYCAIVSMRRMVALYDAPACNPPKSESTAAAFRFPWK